MVAVVPSDTSQRQATSAKQPAGLMSDIFFFQIFYGMNDSEFISADRLVWWRRSKRSSRSYEISRHFKY